MRPKEIKWLARDQRANSWWPSQNPASRFPVCSGFSYTRALLSWDGQPLIATFAPLGCRCLWLDALAGVIRGPGSRYLKRDHGLPGWICTQLKYIFICRILLRSKFKCVMFINVCLAGFAHSALSIYMHYASRLLRELVCGGEPRAVTAQQVASVTASSPGDDL